MFSQIVVGLDGSDSSKNATRVACDLAKHYSSTLTLVHVPHAETAAFVVGAVAGYHAAISKPSVQEIEDAGKKILDEAKAIVAEMGVTTAKTHMSHGDAATEVLSHADKISADLVVTGRRGLSRVSTLIQGSTTQRINHLAKCACLSVP